MNDTANVCHWGPYERTCGHRIVKTSLECLPLPRSKSRRSTLKLSGEIDLRGCKTQDNLGDHLVSQKKRTISCELASKSSIVSGPTDMSMTTRMNLSNNRLSKAIVCLEAVPKNVRIRNVPDCLLK